MPYLIDGHNLIGQTPGLSLDDPDDETKLVLLVRRYCLRERRRATIIFDGGLPGGASSLSTTDVAVIFAADGHTTADDLIRHRIRDEKNPGGLIVVTSDGTVAEAARQRSIAVMPSPKFARLLLRTGKRIGRSFDSKKEHGPDPDEVADWEAWFGGKSDRS